MAWITVAGLAVSAAPAVYKAIKGISQTNQANKLNPVDPGYQMNRGVLDNAKTLSDYYGNYQLPGYRTMLSNINQNYGSAFGQGVKGATSGTDVFALAANMAYGKNNAINDLNVRNAEGKEGAFGAMLNANEKAGQEYVAKNQYDRENYQGQIKAKAALTQAGAENTYTAFDQLAGTASKFLLSGAPTKTGQKGDQKGDQTPFSYVNSGVNPAGGTSGIALGTLDATYDKYYYPDGSPRYDLNGNPIPQNN